MFNDGDRAGIWLYFWPILHSSQNRTQHIINVRFAAGNVLEQSRIDQRGARLILLFIQNLELVLHVDNVIR